MAVLADPAERAVAPERAGPDAGVMLGQRLGERRPVVGGGEPLLEGLAGGGDQSGAVGERLEAVPGHPGIGGLGVGGVGGGTGQAWGVEGVERLEGGEVASDLGQQRRAEAVRAGPLGLAAERRLGLEQAVQQVVLPGVADERLGGQLGLVGEQREEAAVDAADPGGCLFGGERFEQLEEGEADLVGDDASEDAEHPGAEQVSADQGGAARAGE